jgi:NitT/TauT family transport system substrate-binding protein
MSKALAKILALFFVVASMLSGGSVMAQQKLVVRVDFTPWGVHAALHLATERGWFKEEGLNVEVQDGRGSGNTLALVNSGQVDVGQIAMGLLGTAREQGATVKAIAGWERKTDFCVVVDRNSPIHKIADLRGKKIAVFAASPWASYIDDYLKAGGLDRKTVDMVFVDAAALWGTYNAGRVDAMMSTAGSAIPVTEKARPSRCLMLDEANLYFPSYGFVATEKTIATRGEELRKLIKVQQRAWAHIKNNIDDGVKAMLSQRPDANLDPDVVREQIKITLDYFDTPATVGKPLGYQAKEDWEATIESMARVGLVKPGWKVENYYTNELVQ